MLLAPTPENLKPAATILVPIGNCLYKEVMVLFTCHDFVYTDDFVVEDENASCRIDKVLCVKTEAPTNWNHDQWETFVYETRAKFERTDAMSEMFKSVLGQYAYEGLDKSELLEDYFFEALLDALRFNCTDVVDEIKEFLNEKQRKHEADAAAWAHGPAHYYGVE